MVSYKPSLEVERNQASTTAVLKDMGIPTSKGSGKCVDGFVFYRWARAQLKIGVSRTKGENRC